MKGLFSLFGRWNPRFESWNSYFPRLVSFHKVIERLNNQVSLRLLWTPTGCYKAPRPRGKASRQGIIIHMMPLIPPICPPQARPGLRVTFRPRGIGWLTWKQLSKILENARAQFRNQAERKFAENLVIYLNYIRIKVDQHT